MISKEKTVKSVHEIISRIGDMMELEGMDNDPAAWAEIHAYAGMRGNIQEAPESSCIDVVFDGPPDHNSPRFIEVENAEGESISVGQWLERVDGLWCLRFSSTLPPLQLHDMRPGEKSDP